VFVFIDQSFFFIMFCVKTIEKKFVRFYSKPKCGFIGLGNMGANMAPHLIQKGAVSELHVFDLNEEAVNSNKLQKKKIFELKIFK